MDLFLVFLGAGIAALALGAARRSVGRADVRRFARELLGRALPGARTGAPDARTGPATPPYVPSEAAQARFRWTEVVNLTAASTATRPRREAPEARRDDRDVPVESR